MNVDMWRANFSKIYNLRKLQKMIYKTIYLKSSANLLTKKIYIFYVHFPQFVLQEDQSVANFCVYSALLQDFYPRVQLEWRYIGLSS